MTVSREDVMKMSHLARIKISESKIDKLRNDLNVILHFIEQLNEVDCSQVQDSPQDVSDCTHERDDVVEQCDSTLVMSNAPEKECNMFVVPKVVG
ncbi:MAG: Asp-tRNA(Asn)/Glu-tRNA(Gln) amidotransferase subunit GatC [Holosporaceae bacterium]|jgi:aspartyl-tRNA(Asn)/glutamyl-tRNA(Gln) amidotransferase subunit C|nr:Asp-tRNA(Asn)/Glu-tRNA(Gln) amidotransferase subunit GatC [Holosporaceae bacterium]